MNQLETGTTRTTPLTQTSCDPTKTPGREFTLPRRITEWVSAETLASWVQEEVDIFNRNGVLGGESRKALLSVLSFAYVTELFDSEEIRSHCYSDAVLQTLAEGSAFFPEELGQLRRTHRKLLEIVITCLLARAIKAHYGPDPAALPAEAIAKLRQEAVRRLDTARLMEMS
jgi:hypothetical protein